MDVQIQHRGAVHRPSLVIGIGQVDNHDRRTPGDRVEARPLAEEELQLVIHPRGRAAGSQGSAVGAVENQGDRRRIDVEEHHARLTQSVGGVYPTPAVDGGEELLVDCHI